MLLKTEEPQGGTWFMWNDWLAQIYFRKKTFSITLTWDWKLWKMGVEEEGQRLDYSLANALGLLEKSVMLGK